MRPRAIVAQALGPRARVVNLRTVHIVLALGVAACTEARLVPVDGGTDAGARDAGPGDAGPRDAGPRDAGPRDAGPRDAGPPDAGPLTYALTGDAVALPYRGGTFSGLPYSLRCADDELLVGLESWVDVSMPDGGPTRSVVDGIAPVCARLHADGTLGTGNVGPMTGGIEGAVRHSDRCPAETAVVAVSSAVLSTGTVIPLISQIGLTCAPVPTWVASGSGAGALPLRGIDVDGTAMIDTCDDGAFVVGLDGRSGSSIDAVQALCRYVTTSR